MTARRFADRTDAGKQLAVSLREYSGRPDVMVLGLARGGVPLAVSVASALNLPVGAILVRKLGVPGHAETAFGALAWFAGHLVRNINAAFVAELLNRGFRQASLDRVEEDQRRALLERVGAYPEERADWPNRTILLADDGLATGASMTAAVRAVRTTGPAAIVAVAPVGSSEACGALLHEADAVVCPLVPRDFGAVGAYYASFEQVSDAEVLALLASSRP